MTTDTRYANPALANGQANLAQNGATPGAQDETEQARLLKARESFSGRLLTDPQFDEAIAVTKILEREIYRTGAFKDKLKDYAYAMARSENMDARKVEGTIRDLFKERTGQTMNQLREGLKAREDAPKENARDLALSAAHEVEVRMANGDKITFNRAVSEQAENLADHFGVTDAHAKNLMMDSFKEGQGSHDDGNGISWREWGQQLDAEYYRPQVEAEKQARAQAKEKMGENAGPTRSSRRR